MNQEQIVTASVKLAAAAFEVDIAELQQVGGGAKGKNLTQQYCLARGLAFYLPVAFGISVRAVADINHISRECVHNRIKRYQDVVDTEKDIRQLTMDAGTVLLEAGAQAVAGIRGPITPPFAIVMNREQRKGAMQNALA